MEGREKEKCMTEMKEIRQNGNRIRKKDKSMKWQEEKERTDKERRIGQRQKGRKRLVRKMNKQRE